MYSSTRMGLTKGFYLIGLIFFCIVVFCIVKFEFVNNDYKFFDMFTTFIFIIAVNAFTFNLNSI